MAHGKFVSYLRVSTGRQGRSGLGLEAQRNAVTNYLNGGQWQLVAEVVEVESGKYNGRPELKRAFDLCRDYGATLIVAKIDRLTRDAAFLLSLRDAGVDFIAADMPDANRLTVGIMALVAEQEREAISKRTKDALAAAKVRGVQLGAYRDGVFVGRIGTAEDAQKARQARRGAADAFAKDKARLLREADPSGSASLAEIARWFNERGVVTPSGKGQWTPTGIRRLKARLQGIHRADRPYPIHRFF